MKKKLDVNAFASSLRGESVFFPTKNDLPAPDKAGEPQEHPSPVQKEQDHPLHEQASERASINASKHASVLALDTDIESVRKTLKLIGKEVLYVRLTPEEKAQVNDIEYTYQRQGIKTSGNEIGRIALNFLLADYKANGEQSILAKVLAALHT